MKDGLGIINFMAKVGSSAPLGICMMGNLRTARNMEWALLFGLTVANTLEWWRMVLGMAMVSYHYFNTLFRFIWMARWWALWGQLFGQQKRWTGYFLLVTMILIIVCSKNGDKFDGHWKNHVKDGPGIYTYAATGKEEVLVYEEGKLVKQAWLIIILISISENIFI